MKKRMFKWILMVLVLMFSFPAWAEDCVMHVSTKAGENIDVTVKEDALKNGVAHCVAWHRSEAYPAILYLTTGSVNVGGDKPQINVDEDGNPMGEILYEMPLANLSEISFSEATPTGIGQMKSTQPTIDIRDEKMRITGITSPIHVSVADVSGIVKYDADIDSDREIDLSVMGSGVHVVKAGGADFKILIR